MYSENGGKGANGSACHNHSQTQTQGDVRNSLSVDVSNDELFLLPTPQLPAPIMDCSLPRPFTFVQLDNPWDDN